MPNQRAYLVNGNGLRGFDLTTVSATETLPRPTTLTGDWAQKLVRWGVDGFAILGSDKIYIARWSSTIPPGADRNSDGSSDAWAAAQHGTLSVDQARDMDGNGTPDGLEYLFGTSAVRAPANPVTVSATNVGGQTILHLTFPRRVGLAAGSYGYLASEDLAEWSPAPNATETVLSTHTVGGVQIEIVDAAIPSPAAKSGFGRMKWTHP